jgi:hypothetical protein
VIFKTKGSLKIKLKKKTKKKTNKTKQKTNTATQKLLKQQNPCRNLNKTTYELYLNNL